MLLSYLKQICDTQGEMEHFDRNKVNKSMIYLTQINPKKNDDSFMTDDFLWTTGNFLVALF